MNHTAALLPDGRVIVVGGWGYSGELTSTEIYDPENDVWTPGCPELHEGRKNHQMVMAAGRLVVIGIVCPTTARAPSKFSRWARVSARAARMDRNA